MIGPQLKSMLTALNKQYNNAKEEFYKIKRLQETTTDGGKRETLKAMVPDVDTALKKLEEFMDTMRANIAIGDNLDGSEPTLQDDVEKLNKCLNVSEAHMEGVKKLVKNLKTFH